MRQIKPMIFWPELPIVALITKNIVQKYKDDLVFVSTKAKGMPFSDVEKRLGTKVVWLDDVDDIWNRREEFSDRNLFIRTGWRNKTLFKFDNYMRSRGAKIVLTSDNCFKNNLRQWLGAIYFRFFLRNKFDAAIAPGSSGKKLLEFFGMPKDRVFTGILGSDSDIFNLKNVPKKRNNEFLFVGRLAPEKRIDILIKAFKLYRNAGGNYNLRIVGNGHLRYLVQDIPGLIWEDFLPADEIAKRMKKAKCLVLTSSSDHWPTVVHEAASCGCLIMITRFCGNHHDLLDDGKNGYLIKKNTVQEVKDLFFKVTVWDEEMFEAGSEKSVELAQGFGKYLFEQSFNKIVEKLF